VFFLTDTYLLKKSEAASVEQPVKEFIEEMRRAERAR